MKTFYTIVLVVLTIFAIAYIIYTSNEPKFTADIDGSVFKADRVGAHYTSDRLNITAIRAVTDTPIVAINVKAKKIGTYVLNEDNPETGNLAVYFVRKTVFASTSRFTGTITFTELDMEKMEVSGTFAFQAVQVYPQASTVVSVTDGVFKNIPIRPSENTSTHKSNSR